MFAACAPSWQAMRWGGTRRWVGGADAAHRNSVVHEGEGKGMATRRSLGSRTGATVRERGSPRWLTELVIRQRRQRQLEAFAGGRSTGAGVCRLDCAAAVPMCVMDGGAVDETSATGMGWALRCNIFPRLPHTRASASSAHAACPPPSLAACPRRCFHPDNHSCAGSVEHILHPRCHNNGYSWRPIPS